MSTATGPQVIDLRSDTVTRPSPAMRRAIAEAEVGDDVYGEDPSVARLQEQAAKLVGTEAALLVPSGTMANQIAILAQTERGDEILAGRGAHSWLFESGASGAIAGVQVCVLPGDGRFGAAAVHEAFKPDNHIFAPTRLLLVENTHNMGGGLLWERDQTLEVLAAARELGLRAHLDGARLWNAAAASGVSERELAAGFNSVSVCLSKGLGAPVGSLLCGDRDLVHRAHRLRKMLGGGMRQAGILAAAGLYALEHNRDRLVKDHDNARYLAGELSGIEGLEVDVEKVHTNIVMVDVAESVSGGAAALESAARERGLLCNRFGERRIRLVTHMDVDRTACARAAEIFADLVAAA